MKTWEQHYIEHCIKFAEPWGKRPGWAVWHDCLVGVSVKVWIDIMNFKNNTTCNSTLLFSG